MNDQIPEAKKAMIMGIIGAATVLTAIGGIIFGIIGMKTAKVALAKVNEDPQRYKKEKVKATIGKFTGLGGLIGGGFFILYWILIVTVVAAS